MKTSNLAVTIFKATRHAAFAAMLIGMGTVGVVSPAQANSGEASNLVAPYGHFPLAFGPAPGPYTTHYLISSTTGNPTTVNVKCYNDGAQRVGPAGGVNVGLAVGFDMDVFDPVTLGLTTDPSYTGFGWCYFAATGGDVAVTFLVGDSVSGNLITTNNSRFVASGTAQSQVTEDDANIPYWTREGSWDTYILALNPTTSVHNLTVNIYDNASIFQTSWTVPGGTLSARDLDLTSVSALAPAAVFGNADVDIGAGTTDRGFVGWVSGLNFNSGQAFLYSIPLDKDDVSNLVAGDRP